MASRSGAVPVFDFRRDSHHVSGMKFPGRLPFILQVPLPRYHNQHLAGTVMDVPVGVGAVFKGHVVHGNIFVFRQAGKPASAGEKRAYPSLGLPISMTAPFPSSAFLISSLFMGCVFLISLTNESTQVHHRFSHRR